MLLTAANPCRPQRFNLFTDQRHLLYPLAISLALHTLLFWQSTSLSPPPANSATRDRHLQAKMQAKPNNSPLLEAPPIRPTDSAETPAIVRKAAERSDARTSPPAGPPTTEQATKETLAPEPLETTPIEPLRPSIDLAGLREYHMALGRMARQFRQYPPAARETGAQGRVAMRLIIAETGVPISLSLLASSGFPELDQAALDMMHLAAGHTQVPDSLRGRVFNIDLAIDFKPDDTP
jgi:periplasmic protein TonB